MSDVSTPELPAAFRPLEFEFDAARDQWTDGKMTITSEALARGGVMEHVLRVTSAKPAKPLVLKALTAPNPPSRPPQRPAVVAAPSKVSQSKTSAISDERDSHGLSRVRLGRTREAKGLVGGDAMVVVTTQYLDGHALAVSDCGSWHDEAEFPFDPVPWGEGLADFGRLSRAMSSLVVSMSLPDAEEVGPEQVGIFISGHRNLQMWCRRVAEQMSQAEGEMQVVETILRTML